jgi:hypothetical protein
LADAVHRLHVLAEGQAANHQMLSTAQRNFQELSVLNELVKENKDRMQEMWKLFGQESQQVREWASSGFSELRAAVRAKMDEREAFRLVDDIRKEVRDLAPSLSEAMSRLEVDVRHKADLSSVAKLEDVTEELVRTIPRPKQLLIGTKCLACDRIVSERQCTDKGTLLADRQQEEQLWSEVQKALNNTKVDSRPPGSKEVLKYVAIQVGSPSKAIALDGHSGIFDARDLGLGGHHLVRAGGGGGGFSRPQTSCDPSTRRQPREPPPLVRIAPRRPVQTPRQGQPHRMPPGHSMRAALGQMPSTSTPAVDKRASTTNAPAADTKEDDWLLSSLRQQPAAHSGMSQPQATDQHGSIDFRHTPPLSDFGDDSRPVSQASN